jgi:TetR/AcrR family transcriptional regulator, transcriptional repressor for nem operon
MPRQVDSRERLLRTAAELIFLNGYTATTVDQICEKCGIKKGSFYHHFSSKEEVALEAIRTDWEHFKGMLDQAFSPTRTPLERLRAFAKMTAESQACLRDRIGRVCGCPLFALGAEIGIHEPVLRKQVDEHLTLMAKYFESTFREGHALGQFSAPDPKSLAWLVLTFCEGCLTLGRIRNDLQPASAIEEGMFRLLGIPQTQTAAA